MCKKVGCLKSALFFFVHCPAERRTHPRSGVWRAETVVTTQPGLKVRGLGWLSPQLLAKPTAQGGMGW